MDNANHSLQQSMIFVFLHFNNGSVTNEQMAFNSYHSCVRANGSYACLLPGYVQRQAGIEEDQN